MVSIYSTPIAAKHVLILLSFTAYLWISCPSIARSQNTYVYPEAYYGRGSTVDEDALIAAMNNGTIAAAGLDVFENEPNIRPEFLSLPNTVLLPHVGSASVYTRMAMGNLCVDNLVSWFSGKGAVTPVAETAHHQKMPNS